MYHVVFNGDERELFWLFNDLYPYEVDYTVVSDGDVHVRFKSEGLSAFVVYLLRNPYERVSTDLAYEILAERNIEEARLTIDNKQVVFKPFNLQNSLVAPSTSDWLADVVVEAYTQYE